MRRVILLLAVLLALPAELQAQAIVTTTLSSGVGTITTSQNDTYSVASGNGFVVGYLLLVDQEVDTVISVAGTMIGVRRPQGGLQASHSTGATVYVGPPSLFNQGDPTSLSCNYGASQNPWINIQTGRIYTCAVSGVWITPNPVATGGGGGSGTVTSFSSGPLMGLFTTSVATATTTPALSFTMASVGAESIFGNHTGGVAQPIFFQPSLTSSLFANQGTTTTVLHGNGSGNPSFGSIVSADLNLTSTTCTNQFLSALSSTAGGTCTTDVLASAQHANQGTTTTLLHGNAAGNPSFGAVVSADLNLTSTTCTNQFLTALSSAAAGTCTTATLAGAQFANQGTTTTVLHGNAAGNPSFAAVSLTADITGTLGIGNGGTGQTTQTNAFDALAPTTTQGDVIYYNGTDNVRLAAGTSGKFLQTLGSGANPAWASYNLVYPIVAGAAAGHSPAANSTFCYGNQPGTNPTVCETAFAVGIGVVGTITQITGTVTVAGTKDSMAENVNFKGRYWNGSAWSNLGTTTCTFNNTNCSWTISGLSQTTAAGDLIAITFGPTPNPWATAPTAVFYNSVVTVSVP